MLNTIYIGTSGSYTPTRELGKGGEGRVYELAKNTSSVLKIYAEPLGKDKIDKLKLMASISSPQIETYAAWPKDVVVNQRGQTCGFIMKRLIGYVPVHHLFSPMDRKKQFPDKGYNFLIHVARNLATAFYSLHTAGLIVGDVNEGNILVNAQGMIAFIDCDSFQLKNANGYHFCEVGVPRYTPPEILRQSSFNSLVRNENTDSFSMAVLIFQLLFLGRHPFAGKNSSAQDFTEEIAIKNHWFAYSLQQKRHQLLPPDDALPIKSLSDELKQYFHQAFEEEHARPLPVQWMTALDSFLKTMVNCSVSPIHVYSPDFKSCPWCYFKEKRNILYFLDDSKLYTFPERVDIERFINEYTIEKIVFPKLQLNKNTASSILPLPIDSLFVRYKRYNLIANTIAVSGFFLVCILTEFSGLFVLGGVTILTAIRYVLPWKNKLKKELDKRRMANIKLEEKVNEVVKLYNNPPDLVSYKVTADKMANLIKRFMNLPKELTARQKEMEERVYEAQLSSFLQTFSIGDQDISSIGATRKASLATVGIYSAADIDNLQTIKVPGIGAKVVQLLFSWQRQISSTFIYKPDNSLLLTEYKVIVNEMGQIRLQLETDIKTTYQAITQSKASLQNKQSQLQIHINILQKQCLQAKADYEGFKKRFG